MIKYTPTPQAKTLFEALRARGINAILEYYDGHKHVDIAIPDAYIYIEIDGSHHLTSPKQIETDFLRDHYSRMDGFNTIRITNQFLLQNMEGIVFAIIDLVKKRMKNNLKTV